MKIVCHTNLDLHPAERWPNELPCVPAVGDLITSGQKWGNSFSLQLQVYRITWEYRTVDGARFSEFAWLPVVELHMTDWQKMLPASKPGAAVGSIVAFYEWYAPKVGSSVSAFI